MDFIKKNKIIIYISAIILALAVFFLFFVIKNSENNNINLENNSFSSDGCQDNCGVRLIDGKKVEAGQEDPFLISAVIDNHSEARPQFGLSRAEIVYDIPAEGGINRYLAFFRSDIEDDFQIGPIRSVRPYFLDIAEEYQSLLLHCGGSPEALARVIKEKSLTLNEFYNGQYYLRYSGYTAPHNVLGQYGLIKEYLKENNLDVSKFSPWKFKEKEVLSNIDRSMANFNIQVKNGQSQYDVSWDYNLDENNYIKKIAGKEHLDDSGENIKVDNIILQFVKTEILDNELRLKIDLLGQGQAIICLDGYCHQGYWQKNSNKDRTRYYLETNDEIIFNSGKTWVHLIDERTSFSIENF
ncbi:MAG TPA: DUF3048 domain-containing protein [bacterium]|nr:DUF3048 domain-containing protein [bacterium]